MLPAALALIIVGVLLLLIIPWVGIPALLVGIVLLVLYLAGVGRRAARDRA